MRVSFRVAACVVKVYAFYLKFPRTASFSSFFLYVDDQTCGPHGCMDPFRISDTTIIGIGIAALVLLIVIVIYCIHQHNKNTQNGTTIRAWQRSQQTDPFVEVGSRSAEGQLPDVQAVPNAFLSVIKFF